MKKWTSSLAVLTLLCSFTLAQPARAFVGFWTGNIGLTMAGLVVAVAPMAADAMNEQKPSSFSLFSALVGVVLMDGEAGQKLKFVTVGDEVAANLGLTSAEVAAYNAETAELNQVFEAVSSDLDRMEKPSVETSAATWQQYEGAVSADAISAARKIATQLIAE